MSVPSTTSSSFVASYATVPPVPRRVVRDAVPHLERLTSAVLSRGRVAVTGSCNRGETSPMDEETGMLAAQGEGGLGKTTASILVCNDPRVRRAFPGGIYFVKLDEASRETDVVMELAHIVRDSGGREQAMDIESLPQSRQVEKAVDMARKWFAGKAILLVADNVWPRTGSSSDCGDWAPTLAPITGGRGSAFLFSTRYMHLANYVDDPIEFDRLDMGNPVFYWLAQRMFEEYAGIAHMHRAANQNVPADGERLSSRDPAYMEVLDKILKLCDGWPMAIESAGAFARNHKWRWPIVVPELCSLLPSLRGKGGKSGLAAIWGASISFAENLSGSEAEAHNAVFCGLDVGDMRRRFGDNWLTERVAALAVFDAPRLVRASIAALQLGTTVRQAASFLRMCAGLGFGKLLTGDGALSHLTHAGNIRGSTGDDISLALHDLQFAFAVGLCEERTKGVKALYHYHRELLSRLLSARDNCSLSGAAVDWSRAVEFAESKCSGARQYFSRKLSGHFCNVFPSDPRGILYSSVSDPSDGVWTEKLSDFICDYRWMRFCGEESGRSLVLSSWTLLVEVLCVPTQVEEGSISDAKSILSRGAQAAVRTITKVLEAVPAHYFSSTHQAVCQLHGKCDSGLAAQLEGKLSALDFRRLEEQDQSDGLLFVGQLRESVSAHARSLRLSPHGEVVSPLGLEEYRCALVRRGGHGSLYGMAFISCSNHSVLATCCDDGDLRIRDMDNGGKTVSVVFSDATSRVVGISTVGCASSKQGALLACTVHDRTIRVWRVWLNEESRSRRSVERSPPTFRTACIAKMCVDDCSLAKATYLWCVAVSGNRTRVVTGSRPIDPHYAVGSEEKLYEVKVWMLGREDGGFGESSETLGTSDDLTTSTNFRALSLLGHRGNINAVLVSYEGELVVSSSHDGSVRVWRVPIDARNDSDANVIHSFDLERGHPWCLAMSADSQSIFVGTADGCVSIVNTYNGRVRSILSRDEEEGGGVHTMALVESEGNSQTLFCGHFDGTITEWNVGKRAFLGEYGTLWGGSGGVVCIAAQASEEKGEGHCGGETEPVNKCCLASGYLDGRLRVWNTDRKTLPAMQRAVSSRRMPRNHHIPGFDGVVWCAVWSPDGDLVVFGRDRGSIDLWSFSTGTYCGTLRGHKGHVSCINFASDGKHLASVDHSTEARIWSAQEQKCIQVLVSSDEGLSTVMFVAGRLSHVVTGGVAGTISLWDVRSKTCIRSLRNLHSSAIQSLSLPSDWKEWMELLQSGSGDMVGNTAVSVSEESEDLVRLSTRDNLSARDSPARQGDKQDQGRFVGLSRDSDGLRCAWSLQNFEKVAEVHKSVDVDTGLLLAREFKGTNAIFDGTRYLEARNCSTVPRMSADVEQYWGAEYAFCGDGRAEADRMIVSFNNNPREVVVRLVVADAIQCQCTMRLGCDNLVSVRSIVCRAHRAADGTISAVVGCVDDNFRVIFADVVF